MYAVNKHGYGGPSRYSAKSHLKPINFSCVAPSAKTVAIMGDFNDWDPNATPMKRQPDGGWVAQVPLTHGHHTYLFVVDGVPQVDQRAQGITRNARNERVSLIAVS
jgi:1,4-alpha-glucan branching enzyme